MEIPEYERDFNTLYETYADAVFRRCFFKTSNRDVALDLTQEAFMRVWDYLAQEKQIDNTRAFLYTVVNNLIKDWYKKKKSITMGDMEAFAERIPDTRVDILRDAEMTNALRVLEGLDEDDRELIVMRFVDGMSLHDIALLLSEKENTVSVRLHRAMERLRSRVIGTYEPS